MFGRLFTGQYHDHANEYIYSKLHIGKKGGNSDSTADEDRLSVVE